MKIIAKTNEGEIIEVRLQRMFPNCSKYTHCCDENWDKKLERIIKMPIKVDYTILTGYSIQKEADKLKPPEDFENIDVSEL